MSATKKLFFLVALIHFKTANLNRDLCLPHLIFASIIILIQLAYHKFCSFIFSDELPQIELQMLLRKH